MASGPTFPGLPGGTLVSSLLHDGVLPCRGKGHGCPSVGLGLKKGGIGL